MKNTNTIRARSLRRAETDAEKALWRKLRDRRLGGRKFVRQFPVGPFFADVACREAQLMVELDGGQHAESARDVSRDAVLNERGFAVLRFWNNEVFTAVDAICETVVAALEGRLEPYDRYKVPLSGAARHLLPGGEKGSRDRVPERAPSSHRAEGVRGTDERTSSAAQPFPSRLSP